MPRCAELRSHVARVHTLTSPQASSRLKTEHMVQVAVYAILITRKLAEFGLEARVRLPGGL